MGFAKDGKTASTIGDYDMFPRIKELRPTDDYKLDVRFDSGEHVLYDVSDDIRDIEAFEPLKTLPGLFSAVQLDESRTCVFWNDQIDLPSDTILEYGHRLDS